MRGVSNTEGHVPPMPALCAGGQREWGQQAGSSVVSRQPLTQRCRLHLEAPPAPGNFATSVLLALVCACSPHVQVNLSMDPELGTIYSVAVPVKRVKPTARVPLDTDLDTDGITLTVGAGKRSCCYC